MAHGHRSLESRKRLLQGAVPSLEHVTTIEGFDENPASQVLLRRDCSDPALIQYTSGGTGDPKGVLLSHANLLANIRATGQALAVRPDDVTVSWLPLKWHPLALVGVGRRFLLGAFATSVTA